MKTHIQGLLAVVLCLNLTARAQPGRPAGTGGSGPRNGPTIDAAMAKLFGDNTAFSADIQNDFEMSKGKPMTMPGKIAFDSGKSRFEMNMSEAKGTGMSPEMAEHMKSMGMDGIVRIIRPDQKLTYTIYPGLKAYAETPETDPNAAKPAADFKIETTELDKETVDGHPCVKNKAVVTDDQGKQHESTVWNATDLKNFPIKIQTTEEGSAMTMQFKNVKLAKPDAAKFEPPSEFKKYNSVMALMQAEMMKRMQQGGGMGTPPGQ